MLRSTPARIVTHEELPAEIAQTPTENLETSLEYLEDRRLAQDFAAHVAEVLGEDTVAAVLLPWSTGAPPAGIIAPMAKDGEYNMQQVKQAVIGKNKVVIAITGRYEEETHAGVHSVGQLLEIQEQFGLCVLAAHVLDKRNLCAPTTSAIDELMKVHAAIGELRVDDVLLDPEWEPAALKLRFRVAHRSWSEYKQRLQLMLDDEPKLATPAEIAALEATRCDLLWKQIPRELMTHLPRMDVHLEETASRAGDYILEGRMGSTMVWRGKDTNQNTVAIKMTDKADIFSPVEVEGIYREFRFLAGMVKHKNIVRGTDCFHGVMRICIVMEYCGDQNLSQYLSDLPGQRMQEDKLMDCFYQVSCALLHCHKGKVCHRSISLRHILMSEADGVLVPKLVDFRSAMIAKEGVLSSSLCGCLPYIAPEMLAASHETPFLSLPTDLWSVGVLLLEMAGGKGSFCRAVWGAVQIDENVVQVDSPYDERVRVGAQIEAYFQKDGCHTKALTCMGASPEEEVVTILKKLLSPSPEDRSSLAQIIPADILEAEKKDEEKEEEQVAVGGAQ